MKTFNSMSVSLLGMMMLMTMGKTDAHGYTTISRNWLCKDGRNFDCGSIIYEPQSLEAVKGFPASGPPDGQIPSAGIARFGTLDEQTPFRWLKTPVTSGGSLDFTWKFTANHRTTGYEYFITKAGWNPDAPLTRAQFDSSPFCTVNGGGVQPPISGVTHTCNLPSRTGYHVILAVWIIDDTVNAFYNMNDVQFGGSNPPPTPTPPTPTPPTPPAPTPPAPTPPAPTPPAPTPPAPTPPAPTPPAPTPPAPTPPAPTPPAPTPPAPTPPTSNICASGQLLVGVNDCTAFVYCVNGQVTGNPVPCPAGTLFDQNLMVCNWDYNVNCGV